MKINFRSALEFTINSALDNSNLGLSGQGQKCQGGPRLKKKNLVLLAQDCYKKRDASRIRFGFGCRLSQGQLAERSPSLTRDKAIVC